MKPIRIGFVGAGWMGSAQFRALARRPDVELRALHEPNVARGRELLASVGLPELATVYPGREPAVVAATGRVVRAAGGPA